MPIEADAKQVENLALEEVGAGQIDVSESMLGSSPCSFTFSRRYFFWGIENRW